MSIPNRFSSEIDPFVSSGTYPTREGNQVQLLIDGEPAFWRVCEAIESAKHSVWATITFMWAAFRMPDGRGTALEVLDRAAKRGVDVRLIFWRPDETTSHHFKNAFWGSREQFALLEQSQPKVSIRWDCAAKGYCQHQKTWLIDAGFDGQTAFLGGLNLNPNSMVKPGHHGEGQNHDVYIELVGSAVADVQHNFVQRWNESSEREIKDGSWGHLANTNLEFPQQLPAARGNTIVQIQRTMHSRRYFDNHAPVGSKPFPIIEGEHTNFVQYCSAINFAKRSIYIENQALEVVEVIKALHQALARGVEVVVLLPVKPDVLVSPTEAQQAMLEARAALVGFENFTLAGIAGLSTDGLRKPVWVHSKLMLIDDTWATIGSANLHRWSMFGNSELNAAIFSPETVRGFRVALLEEHLGLDTSLLSDIQALHLFGKIARDNLNRFLSGGHAWQGLAIELDALTYASKNPKGW